MLLQLRERHVTKRANLRQDSAKLSNALFALCAAQIVFAGGHFVFHHGVADDELETERQFHKLKFQRAAIKHERVRSAAVTGYELIHDADTSPDKLVLSLLTQFCKFDAVDGVAALMKKRESHGNFDCCGGTES